MVPKELVFLEGPDRDQDDEGHKVFEAGNISKDLCDTRYDAFFNFDLGAQVKDVAMVICRVFDEGNVDFGVLVNIDHCEFLWLG